MTAEILEDPRLPSLKEYLSQPNLCVPLPDRRIAGDITAGEIFSIFYNSSFGSALACNDLRYTHNHGYDPRELMRLELGTNCDPWGHNFLVANYAHKLVSTELFHGTIKNNAYQLSRVLIAAGAHDWEEAIVPDIAYGLKTDDDRITASEVNDLIWESLYENIFPEHFIKDVKSLISHEDEQSTAHDLVEIAHNTADYITAVKRAAPLSFLLLEYGFGFDQFVTPENAQQRFVALTSLSVIVSQRMREKLQHHARKYRSPAMILESYSEIQQRIDTELAPLVDPNHP